MNYSIRILRHNNHAARDHQQREVPILLPARLQIRPTGMTTTCFHRILGKCRRPRRKSRRLSGRHQRCRRRLLGSFHLRRCWRGQSHPLDRISQACIRRLRLGNGRSDQLFALGPGQPDNAGGGENSVAIWPLDSNVHGAWNDESDAALHSGVVELPGKADKAQLSSKARALIGNWYEGGKSEAAVRVDCWYGKMPSSSSKRITLRRERAYARMASCSPRIPGTPRLRVCAAKSPKIKSYGVMALGGPASPPSNQAPLAFALERFWFYHISTALIMQYFREFRRSARQVLGAAAHHLQCRAHITRARRLRNHGHTQLGRRLAYDPLRLHHPLVSCLGDLCERLLLVLLRS